MRPGIRVRYARSDDRAAMLDITRDLWEGTDYVPSVWSEWLEDRSGCVQVAEIEGRMVGLQHCCLQPDRTCWLEGIRVASSRRGQGVARSLLEHGLDWARARSCSAARLMTSSENPATNRLAVGAGFRQVTSYRQLQASPADSAGDLARARLALPHEAERVRAFLASRARGSPFYTQGWTAYRLDEHRLRLLLARHAVAVAGDGAIDALAIATCTAPFTTLWIGLLTGSREGVRALCYWVRAVAARTGGADVRANLEAGPSADEAEKCGYRPRRDATIVLYELPLVGTLSHASYE